MKKKSLLTLMASLLTLTSLSAVGCDHSVRRTNNYLAPIGRLVLNPQNEDGTFAFSFLGEAGVRNYRINGTAGTWTTERSRFKVGGEYLDQKLAWNFRGGRERHWVQQGGVAADWQYLLDCESLKAFDIKGFYSYSPTKKLSSEWCGQFPLQFCRKRYLAGAQNYGGSFGTTLAFNDTSTLDLSVIYDFVRYRKTYYQHKVVAGFGGGFTFNSRLPGCVDLMLQAEFRRPFNYYGIKFSYPKGFGSSVTSSIFANYTRGKEGLPNALAVGLEFALNFGGCGNNVNPCGPLWDPCNLADWVSTPAFYSPEVLAIRDECSSHSQNGLLNAL